MTTTEWRLFIDGSVNPQTGHGFGASLLVASDEIVTHHHHYHPFQELETRIQIHEFTDTSSTKLELQTLLRALAEDVPVSCAPLTVYTDSQNTVGLVDRRAYLEAHNYYTQKGTVLRHAALYQAFFKVLDQRGFQLVKVDGHKKKHHKTGIDRIFALVDQAARKACRTASASTNKGVGVLVDGAMHGTC